MCNGNSTRTSYGGTIAILKSASVDPSLAEMSLLLADDHRTGNTMATLSGVDSPASERHVVIQ